MDRGKIESAIATMEAQIAVFKVELAKEPRKPVEKPAEEKKEGEEEEKKEGEEK